MYIICEYLYVSWSLQCYYGAHHIRTYVRTQLASIACDIWMKCTIQSQGISLFIVTVKLVDKHFIVTFITTTRGTRMLTQLRTSHGRELLRPTGPNVPC